MTPDERIARLVAFAKARDDFRRQNAAFTCDVCNVTMAASEFLLTMVDDKVCRDCAILSLWSITGGLDS